eukprot:1218958-Rhodomonas_salina.1
MILPGPFERKAVGEDDGGELLLPHVQVPGPRAPRTLFPTGTAVWYWRSAPFCRVVLAALRVVLERVLTRGAFVSGSAAGSHREEP